MTALIGTSGWQYKHWRERYYPRGLPQGRWFEKLLADFMTVELNVSFYRLPRREVFVGWRERSPADAVITVKASRYLTHIKRLRDPASSVALLMERASGLGPKLGPVLVQLPPDLTADVDGLSATLRAFPAGTRLAVEPRHPSWWTDDVRAVLVRHGAALVWADRHSRPLTPLWRTAPFGYLRLHEGRAQPHPRYGSAALRSWAERIDDAFGRDDDVFVYFNNDGGGAAIVDAVGFAQAAQQVGLPSTRVPELTAAAG